MSYVIGVTLSGDGHRAVVACEGIGSLLVFDTNSGEEIRRLRSSTHVHRGTGEATALALSSDGHKTVLAWTDCTLELWDVDNGRELHTFTAASSVTAVALSADGSRVVSACADGTLEARRLDLPVSESAYELDPILGKVVEHSADGKRYIVGVRDGDLRRLKELIDKSGVFPSLQPEPSR